MHKKINRTFSYNFDENNPCLMKNCGAAEAVFFLYKPGGKSKNLLLHILLLLFHPNFVRRHWSEPGSWKTKMSCFPTSQLRAFISNRVNQNHKKKNPTIYKLSLFTTKLTNFQEINFNFINI